MTEIPSGTFRGRCEDEVVDLHRFFERWYRGEPDAHGEEFARVSDVLAEDFRMVTPEGAVVARSELLAGIRGGHGSKEDFRIRIENLVYRMGVRGGVAVVTYEEWQEEGGEDRGRVSTAVLHERPDAPNGVEWLHVHETWLPEE